jgi:hypothetical protein
MTVATVAQEISEARESLAPHMDILRGDLVSGMWLDFGAAAQRYRDARGSDKGAREFAGVCRGLKQDAMGAANNPLNLRPVREPWATMPVDGSGRLSTLERVAYGAIGAACMVALLFMGWTLGIFGGVSPDAPAAPALTSATVADTGADVDMRDREMITRGSYWSWAAADGCARGTVECDRALREVNGEAALYGLHVWEDGSVSPR